MAGLLRIVGGGVAALLWMIGRGSRMTGGQLASAPDYYFGTALQVLAAVLALVVFVLFHRTRLGGPAPSRRWTSPRAVGWSFVVLAAFLLVSAASMFTVAAVDAGASGTLMRRYLGYLGTPDVALKTISALFAAGAGAAAVARSTNAAALVRLAAIPLALVWPHATMVAAWGAWSTLGAAWQTLGAGSRSATRKAAVIIPAVLVMLVVGQCLKDRFSRNLFQDSVSDSAEHPSDVALLAAGSYLLLKLPNGVSIELPRNWVIISGNQRVTLDAWVQARTEKLADSPLRSELSLAANYYDDRGQTAGIFNIRYYPEQEVTQREVREASPEDLAEIDAELRKNLLPAVEAAGNRLLEWRGTRRIDVNGIAVLLSEYRRTSRQVPAFRAQLARVLAGARSFTVTISYREDQEYLLAPICERVLRTIRM